MKKIISILMIVATISLAAFGKAVYLTVPPATFNFNTVTNLKMVKMITEKFCAKCNIVKPISEFYKRNNIKIGIQSICKVCDNQKGEKYSHSKEGLITCFYKSQKFSSKKRGHNPPTYTKQELYDWCFSQKLFHELYDNWKASNFDKMKIPSCDRTDDYKGYSLDRLQLMTWEDNCRKGCLDAKNGVNNKNNTAVIGTHKITGEKIEFYSQSEAARITKSDSSAISKCCNGKLKSAGGYYWEYKV